MRKKKKIILIVSVILAAVIVLGGIGLYFLHRADYFCQYAPQISLSEIKNGEKITLIAHRGYSAKAPENSLSAYKCAAEAGYEYAETDVRYTADGEWVITHDNSLKRMTGFKGNVEEMTVEEIKKHRITKGANVDKYNSEYTPTLGEFLDVCQEYGVKPVIEIKVSEDIKSRAAYGKILDALAARDMIKDAVIISFDSDVLTLLRGINPYIYMMYLSHEFNEEVMNTAEKIENCGLAIQYKSLLDNKDFLISAIEQGYKINAWTVDSEDVANELATYGVQMITTNGIYPGK